MKSANKRFTQKAIAVVVIVTLLYGAGVAPVVMMFITGVVLIVFMFSRRSQNREIEKIFDFYLAADSILRDEDRSWYGFEVSEVIENGEMVLDAMPDPPPLHLFTLGALHQLVGNHSTALEYLSHIVDDESFDERNRMAPSGQLRRYVNLLRKIEAEPSFAPQTLGAIRSLERIRRRRAATMLTESRMALKIAPKTEEPAKPTAPVVASSTIPVVAPPPISDVLNDVYADDNLPSN